MMPSPTTSLIVPQADVVGGSRQIAHLVTVYELSVALGVNYIELLKPDVQARRERD
jgi:hypothetical protein